MLQFQSLVQNKKTNKNRKRETQSPSSSTVRFYTVGNILVNIIRFL